MSIADKVTVAELDRDPYPVYARMRQEEPVCFVPAVGLWFVTRWADVEQAATQPDVFGSRVDPSPLERAMGGDSILLLDGEPQKRLRAMLDPSLRPRVVEASAPELVTPIVERLLAGLTGRGEAELMSEYFEPVSVLSLGQVLGLPDVEGDTLRRWFHGLAQGAINFEDDPAKWAASDAAGAEIDRDLTPVFERLWEQPDSSTISTMLQHADGTLSERIHAILPTLKVILLGGMQEPGHAAGSTVAGSARIRVRPPLLAADPAGLVRDAIEEGLRWVSPIGTQTRRALVDAELGGTTLPAGSNLGALVSSANRDEEIWGPTADAYDLYRPKRNHGAFGFGPHSAPVTTSRGCRCGSPCNGCSNGCRRSAPGSGPTTRLQRVGVPRAAASARPLGRVMPARPRRLPTSKTERCARPGRALSTSVLPAVGRPVRRLRTLVHAPGMPAHGRLARGRGDPLRLPRLAVRAGGRHPDRGAGRPPDLGLPGVRDRGRTPRGRDPYPARVTLRPRRPARTGARLAPPRSRRRPGGASTARARAEPPIDDRLRLLLEAALPEAPGSTLEVLEMPAARWTRRSPRSGHAFSPSSPRRVSRSASSETFSRHASTRTLRSGRPRPRRSRIRRSVGWPSSSASRPRRARSRVAARSPTQPHSRQRGQRAIPGSRHQGLGGSAAAIYCSEEAHYSIERAAELLGIGSANVRALPIDGDRRLVPEAVASAIRADRAAGCIPVAVVATAGTTLTGAVDPIGGLADVCAEAGVWLHVDGAYGLPAATTPSAAHLFTGLDRADSVTLDAHKWLYLPKACGCCSSGAVTISSRRSPTKRRTSRTSERATWSTSPWSTPDRSGP